MNENGREPTTETLAETADYIAWKAIEPDGEETYHLELNSVTIHFFEEEWNQFKQLVNQII